MLTTPLGDIEIYVDDNKVEYMEKNIRVSDKLCPDVSGRYAIKIDFIPDGKIHTISCKIKGHVSSEKDGIELGERLELKSFYKDNTKLSIGMEGESGYYADGMCISDIYDYDNEYMEDGVLYDKGKTTLIYFPIKDERRSFSVPDGVICLGKHCFYACDHLHEITVPESVIRFENNPFSGCEHLSLESHTPHYVIENGVIYNKFKTTIVGCLNGSQIDCLRIPETVSLISRNSFWNCKGVKKIVITKTVDRIGYNPFAGCENLIIESENDNFVVKNGVVYDKTLTHMLCATDKAIGKEFTLPDGITHINRGVFSGCKSLENIDFNGVTYIDKSSFTNCVGLTDIYVPDTVTYIGEWAFAYCVNLKKVSIGKNTFVDKNAFNECSAVIERRN